MNKQECCIAKKNGGVDALEEACAAAIRKDASKYFTQANVGLSIKTGVDIAGVVAGALGGPVVAVVAVADGIAGLAVIDKSKDAINAAKDKAIKENCKCP